MNEHSNPGSIFEKSPGFFNKKIETESFQCDFVGVYHNRRTIEKSGELLREIIAQTEILITELAVFSDASQDDGIEYFYRALQILRERQK